MGRDFQIIFRLEYDFFSREEFAKIVAILCAHNFVFRAWQNLALFFDKFKNGASFSNKNPTWI